jgi:hypothetical protein
VRIEILKERKLDQILFSVLDDISCGFLEFQCPSGCECQNIQERHFQTFKSVKLVVFGIMNVVYL